MIINLTHNNYGEMAVQADAITEVSVWDRLRHGRSSNEPNSTVAWGGESGWAFRDDAQILVTKLEAAAGIVFIAATCACERHGVPTWLARDHIISARANGPNTTDVQMRWGSSWRSLALHEPCADFIRRWQESYVLRMLETTDPKLPAID